MKSVSFSKQALPLAKARFPRCANVATHFARKRLFNVERNVAPRMEPNVEGSYCSNVERIIPFEISIRVDNAKSARVLIVASTVALPLHSLFLKLLPLPLTVL